MNTHWNSFTNHPVLSFHNVKHKTKLNGTRFTNIHSNYIVITFIQRNSMQDSAVVLAPIPLHSPWTRHVASCVDSLPDVFIIFAFQDVLTTDSTDSTDSIDSTDSPRDPNFAASSHRRQHTSIVSALAGLGTGGLQRLDLLGSAWILAL